MSGNSRWSFTMLAVVAALSAPATSHAQFGKILKKKAAEAAVQRVAPADTTAASTGTAGDANATARKEAWDHPVAITSATLEQFAKALKAENASRAKYIAGASPTSAIGKWNAYQSAKDKCKSDAVKDDSTQARLQRTMMAEASTGKADKIKIYSDSMQTLGLATNARNERCSALVRPVQSDADWKEMHAEEDREEAAGAAAGGLQPLAYSRLKERVIAYLLMPSGWKPSGYAADETKAVDARSAELKTLVGSDYNSSGQRISLGN